MDSRIQLAGFKDIDESAISIIKKNVATHLRKFEEITKKLEQLHITLKKVHKKEKSEKYEVHALLIDNGKKYAAEYTERNLLAVVDRVLEKLIHEIER